jgi:hypothetical protein
MPNGIRATRLVAAVNIFTLAAALFLASAHHSGLEIVLAALTNPLLTPVSSLLSRRGRSAPGTAGPAPGPTAPMDRHEHHRAADTSAATPPVAP